MSKLHLVMPMAGRGSRFFENGFVCPKPLIEIHGKPFFYWATRSIEKNIELDGITFVVLKEHLRDFDIGSCSLWDSTNLKRQIPKGMELAESMFSNTICSDGRAKDTLVIMDDHVNRPIKKAIPKRHYEVLLDKRLEAKHRNLICVCQPAHPRGII